MVHTQLSRRRRRNPLREFRRIPVLVAGGTEVLRDIRFHELPEKHCHGLPQEIGRCVCQHSAQVLKQWYIRGGHSVCVRLVWSLQRNHRMTLVSICRMYTAYRDIISNIHDSVWLVQSQG